jgi:hypothetical protein
LTAVVAVGQSHHSVHFAGHDSEPVVVVVIAAAVAGHDLDATIDAGDLVVGTCAAENGRIAVDAVDAVEAVDVVDVDVAVAVDAAVAVAVAVAVAAAAAAAAAAVTGYPQRGQV